MDQKACDQVMAPMRRPCDGCEILDPSTRFIACAAWRGLSNSSRLSCRSQKKSHAAKGPGPFIRPSRPLGKKKGPKIDIFVVLLLTPDPNQRDYNYGGDNKFGT